MLAVNQEVLVSVTLSNPLEHAKGFEQASCYLTNAFVPFNNTGHSLGGALAELLALDLSISLASVPVAEVTP
jgi:Lipase (class 3)